METALAKVTNDLLIASDQGFVSVLVLLDLSAAFDTIDHQILFQRPEQLISIKGTALNWYESYFSVLLRFLFLSFLLLYLYHYYYFISIITITLFLSLLLLIN